MKKKKKRNIRNVLPIIGIMIGLCILGAYPAMDLFYAIQHASQGKRIQRAVSGISRDDYRILEQQAQEYNSALAGGRSADGIWPYEKQLAVEGEGKPFAELLIPKISLDMPIYHGTSEEVLMNGVGHLEGTSLPVGGISTHSILTAHSGMTGMRAFDDIRQLKQGDLFFIKVLGNTLAYQVDRMEVLWPDEADQRTEIVKGEDRCTLITCTPYGVNDHRLLVYGKRTAYSKAEAPGPSVQQVVTNRRYMPFLLAVLVILLFAAVGFIYRKKKHQIKAHEGGKSQK